MEEIFASILNCLLYPFTYLVSGEQRIFVGYLGTAFLLAGFLSWRMQKEKRGLKGLLQACFPKEHWLHRSHLLDMKFFYVNTLFFTLLLSVFFSSALVGITLVAEQVNHLLEEIFGSLKHPFSFTTLAIIGFTLLIAFLGDFALFLTHYLQHHIPFLWEFHKVHHSAEVMTPITVYRMHPVDDMLGLLLGSLFMGLGLGAFQYLFLEEPTEFMIAGLNIVTFVFYVAFYNLRHSHVWIHFPGIFGQIFISPAQHQIHHSEAKRHWDKNFGVIFSIWDRWFGTLYIPKEKETLKYGIGAETTEYNSLTALYCLPFQKNGHRMKARWKARRSKLSGTAEPEPSQPSITSE
jgi:sterol desaturase/sphingolipid hydroxylase (fatty acid hydroxylase superfamily)